MKSSIATLTGRLTTFIAFSTVLLVFWSATARSQTILVSNLTEPFRGSTPIGNNPNPIPPPDQTLWYWGAQSFQTNNQPYELTSIDTIVGDGSMDPLAVVDAKLYSADNAGEIGTLLTTFTAPSMLGSASTRNFSPDSPVTLAPNTFYWFVLGSQAPGDGTFYFHYADTSLFSGPGSLSGFADSSDSGANWLYHGIDQFPYYLQVNVAEAGVAEWNVDSLGDWNVNANWNPSQAPNNNFDTATFGSIITAPRTVVVDSTVTVKSITFDNANMYAIAGTASVNLEAVASNAAINVAQGTHEFQVRVNLGSDTDIDVAMDATLEFNNRLDLGGKTLTKSGDGAIKVNNDLNTGGGSIVVVGGTLGGGGTIGGDLNNPSAVVGPGNSPGVLSVSGDYVQGAVGTLAIEIAGTTVDTEYDQLNVMGNATLDGKLLVTLLSGFTPQVGDTFDVLNAAAISGNFATLDLPALAGGKSWDTSLLYTDGILSISAALVPGDFDSDGDVDGADFVAWQTHFPTASGATLADGDSDG
ncbi:MAG: hypothetical protein IT427_20970, partial [Pirellulales bacterium]|nr:hypothetical protein [Pirellulales bacterium]